MTSILPQGINLNDRIQVFINLSTEIGDFATLANGHLVLSVREVRDVFYFLVTLPIKGYNLVISEMARHNLPVIANNYPAFQDRIISGKRGNVTIISLGNLLNKVDGLLIQIMY